MPAERVLELGDVHDMPAFLVDRDAPALCQAMRTTDGFVLGCWTDMHKVLAS